MGENGLIDRSGCTLKMEPLASVRQLERFLLKMVAKQWYGQKDMILFLILIIFFQHLLNWTKPNSFLSSEININLP